MLFGDIDWNQVMMKGLIGAAIGGAIGLCVGLVRMFGAKKDQKPREDSDDAEDRPRRRRD